MSGLGVFEDNGDALEVWTQVEDVDEKGIVVSRGGLRESAGAWPSPDFERTDVSCSGNFIGEQEGMELSD